MKEVDYIIVGLGLAGIAFCEQCALAGKSVMVYDQGGPSASRVAAGLYNPVILKRYTLPWKAEAQFDLALTYFSSLEKKLDVRLLHPMPVHKVFASVADQNNWFAASGGDPLRRFMKPTLIRDPIAEVNAPFDYGEVLETGRVDITLLQKSYQKYLEQKNAFAKATFDYDNITFIGGKVRYEDVVAKGIIFAEGYGVTSNPYFKKLPLVGNKGEYIYIKSPELKQTAAIKSTFFIVPLGADIYKVGATYNWEDKDSIPSTKAKTELLDKLNALITCDYEVIDHEAGMRPTTGDRRALVGRHPKFPTLSILNGLGTRGIMAGPYLAQHLFDHLEQDAPLPPEIDIARFPKKLR